MNDRKMPIQSNFNSMVIYPSSIYSLEVDEIFPYERFAHNIFRTGVEVLNNKKLPEKLEVEYCQYLMGCTPWTINASIKIDHDIEGKPNSYKISIPEFTPALYYIFSAIVANYLFDNNKCNSEEDSDGLIERIKYFIDGANAGVSMYKEKGLGYAIRSLYDFFNLKILDINKYIDYFDLLIKQIAYHEIAHAYTLDRIIDKFDNASEKCALEYIADLVSISWIFKQLVFNTPDSSEYRNYRGLETYTDTIIINSLLCINSLIAKLLLSAIAGAQLNGGIVTFSGGINHPHGFIRFHFQIVHLLNLINFYYKEILSKDQLNEIMGYFREKIKIIMKAGIITLDDLNAANDTAERENIEQAENLIVSKNIQELLGMEHLLQHFREITRNIQVL